MKVDSYVLNELITSGVVTDIKSLPCNPLYLRGQVIWSSYWQKYYIVLEVQYKTCRDYRNREYQRLVDVKVKWSDGKITKHCTSLNPDRDYILVLSKRAYKELQG